jgi:16S rRNA G966 N2-methylase RsmD
MKQQVKISKVKGNPSNPRIIKNDKFKKLVKSIQEFPEMLKLRPIVVDEDMMVLGGNMRLKASKEAGLSEVWIDIAEGLTEEQKKEFIVKDNVGFGEWEWDILANEWDSVQLAEWGLDVWENEDDKVTEGLIDDDEIPEVKESIVKRGDIWQLGEHRLMCGDSTSSDDVEKLMNGEKADMVFTDPPYGIAIVGGNGKVGGDNVAKNGVYSEVIGDETTDTARDFYNTCISLGMDKFIIWGGNYFTDFLPFSKSWIVWDKRGDMNSNNFADGEMAWCSFHTRIRIYKQIWNGMIREGESGKRVHPTQKPLRTLTEIIKDHIKGDIIYDGFLGSGSTLIAAQQCDKKCYGIELDEKYCDVIINRWEQFTGLKAIHEKWIPSKHN